MSPVLEINVRRTNSVRRGLQMIVFVWATVHFFFCPQISDTKHIWIQLIVVLGTLEEQSANCSDLTDQKKKLFVVFNVVSKAVMWQKIVQMTKI